MDLHIPPPEIVPYGLRAMKMVASADGVFDESERSLLRTAQQAFGSDIDVDGLEPIEPEELAARITAPELRRQLVRGMTILSMVDGEASREEAEVCDRFAAALGVESEELRTLRKLAGGQLMRARLDIARRFWVREKIIEQAKRDGIGWLARSIAALAGVAEDRRLAEKYRALETHPMGSLGRAYFDFIRSNQFSFPGEKGSPPEPIVLHDMTHTLSGYGTDPAGELQVLAFHAGCRREEKDPFSFLLFGLAQFHLGVQISPIADGDRGNLDPPTFLVALQRGAACTIDPTDGWDPWSVMERDLEELRAEYSIAPPRP